MLSNEYIYTCVNTSTMKTRLFLQVIQAAEKTYGKSEKRLAADGWSHDWKTLICTILSAQSRDETTIPIAEALFKKFPTLQKLANAKFSEVKHVLKSLNYNNTKSKNVIACARMVVEKYNGRVPDAMDALLTLPGVGRKTANLIITECYKKAGICVDTHVHRIANVLGLVKTRTPQQTEFALQKIAPKKYWASINRLFVLWGKDVPGKNKKKLLERVGLDSLS